VLSVKLYAPQRDFGYLVGDTISTDAIIDLAQETLLDTRSLPVPGPLTATLELRRIAVSSSGRGHNQQVTIHAEYQNFLAPEQVTATELPSYDLRFKSGTANATAHIPAWAFHVSPLRVAQRSAADMGDLRPNRMVAPAAESASLAGLVASIVVALAGSAVFASGRGWLPSLRVGKKNPFALAAARIGKRNGKENTEVWFTELHRAFDATAGHRILPEDVGTFISGHPRFAPLHADIAKFFNVSQQRFFARGGTAATADINLRRLAKSLRRLERRR